MADDPLVVLDTNVVVSALLNVHGAPARILELVLAGEITAAVDARILSELEEVLTRPEFAFRPGDVEAILEVLRRETLIVTARPLRSRLTDPSDEPFLEVAAAAGAVLVTGNLRHFPADRRQGVKVLSPRQFLDSLR